MFLSPCNKKNKNDLAAFSQCPKSGTLGRAELRLNRFPFWRTSQISGIFRYVTGISTMGLLIGRIFKPYMGTKPLSLFKNICMLSVQFSSEKRGVWYFNEDLTGSGSFPSR